MDASTTVGIVANPASARDIRRIVAHGGAVTTHDKLNQLQRVMAGLTAVGVEHVISMADGAGIMTGLRHRSGLPSAADWPTLTFVDQPITRTGLDTTTATAAMVEAGVGSIVVLGGDGTNRIVAEAAVDVPLVPISTGTNNAFPQPTEPTVAGLAAGLVAMDPACRLAGTYQAKSLQVECGRRLERALVDVAISTGDGVGTGAVWDTTSISELFLCFAEPQAIGLSAVGGHLHPIDRRDPTGLSLTLGQPSIAMVRPPIGPGLVASVDVRSISPLEANRPVAVRTSSGVVAIDGERLFRFRPNDRPTITLRSNGPIVVDVNATLDHAARTGVLTSTATRDNVGSSADTPPENSTSTSQQRQKGNQRDATQSARPVHRDGSHPAVRVQDPAGVPR